MNEDYEEISMRSGDPIFAVFGEVTGFLADIAELHFIFGHTLRSLFSCYMILARSLCPEGVKHVRLSSIATLRGT